MSNINKKLNGINKNISELQSLLNKNKSNNLNQQLENINTEKIIINENNLFNERNALVNRNNILNNNNYRAFQEYINEHPNEKEGLERYFNLSNNEKEKRLKKNIELEKKINELEILGIKNQPNKIEILRKKLNFLKENNKFKNNFNEIIETLTTKSSNNNLKGRVDFLKTQLVILDEIKKKIKSNDIKKNIIAINSLIADKIEKIKQKEDLIKKLEKEKKSFFKLGSKKETLKDINSLKNELEELKEELKKLEDKKKLLERFHMTNKNKNSIINEIKKQIKEIIKNENNNDNENEKKLLIQPIQNSKYTIKPKPNNLQLQLLDSKIRELNKNIRELTLKKTNNVLKNKVKISNYIPLFKSINNKIDNKKKKLRQLKLNRSILIETKKKI
jgi:hypothetical protein